MNGKASMRILGPVVLLAILAIVGSAQAASSDAGREGTVVMPGSHLMWVTDARYAVTSGWGKSPLMPQAQAHEFLDSMNAGRIENFGYQDWRLASIAELRWLPKAGLGRKIKGGLGDLTLLNQYLASRSAEDVSPNGTAMDSGSVYAWPVRNQGSGGSDFAGVVILAANSVALKMDTTVSGDVVVNDASPGPTLGPPTGFELSVDKKTSVGGNLRADSIKIFNQATVDGDVFANELINDGTINGNVFPFDPPVFDELPPFQQGTLGPGVQDVVVGAGQTASLDAGDYGDITVDDFGTLNFTGGIYNIRSIDAIGDDATISFDLPSEVRILDKFRTRRRAQIGPSAGSSISAADIILYVAGINGTDGDLNSIPESVRVGADSVCNANFYAPNGTFRAEVGSNNTGAFFGRDVRIDSRAQVSLDSFFEKRTPPAAPPGPPTADPQDVFTDGDNNLDIILTGSDPQGENLTFSISVPPDSLIGSIVSGPTAIQDPPTKSCSVTHSACTVNADCPMGETCDDVFPPITRASVTYDPVDDSNTFNNFTFKVTNESAQEASAVVQINPGGDPTPAPPVLGTVVARDGAAETTTGSPLTIQLQGDAPCDTVGPDGECTAGVSLTFAIEADCGDPGPDAGDCASPSAGTLSSLTPSSATVVRTATVVYTPTGPAGTADSFEFEVCGDISGNEVCDIGTVSVTTEAPLTLAENIEVAIEANQSVDIPLVGNSGGAGGAAPSSALPDTMSRAGSGDSIKIPLRGQTSIGGRLVYIGSDPSSDQHTGSAAPPYPNAASQLAANAAVWAGNSSEPAIACVEGDPVFFGSHVEDMLNSEGLDCASVIAAADLDTAELGGFDVLYTGATRDNVPDLVAAAGNVQDFVDAGGGLVVEANIVDAASWSWVPFASEIGHSGSENVGGAAATIVELLHPVMAGLSDTVLSNWGISVHSTFVNAAAAGFQILALGEHGLGGNLEPYIIALDPGGEPLVYTITSLPLSGTLKDSTGTAITSVPYILPDSMVTYTNTAPAISDSFGYQVDEGAVFSTAVITVFIDDNCAAQGRPPGCAPNP